MRKLKLGAAGLGRAFSFMAETFARDPRVDLVAAADPRPDARRQFELDFKGKAFSSLDELLSRGGIDALYVSTPHQFHREHVLAACAAKKHVLVEKPMALTLEDCHEMTEAAERAGVHLVVGHSHSFDLPIKKAKTLIDSGAFGRVRMITALNFTDFLYRPRRPEELDTTLGGGAVFNQAAHHVDMARLLGGGRVSSVRAMTGDWDASRPTEGAYSALLTFEDGAFASLTYSGYAHFDSDELVDWVGELGQRKNPEAYGATRRALHGNEMDLKNARNYGGNAFARTVAAHHNHFGLLVVSCEKADLRPLPHGVMVYGDAERRLEPLPAPQVPRAEVIDELYDAVVSGKPPLHGGAWSAATLEVCLAILESARARKEVPLSRQTSA
jgi:phthalate 4,5-cis-dihydrodiol dehydrogenase